MVADLSHWINIAETNTEDPDLTAVIEKFADKFDHTHCRVGYDHGPQVPDPRKGKFEFFFFLKFGSRNTDLKLLKDNG